jgi:DNA-directed RNA polymerase subunit RPC12/RpoP
MSKHNNNLGLSSSAKCSCGRQITIGEEYSGMNYIDILNYECPDCKHRRYSKPLTAEEYYRQFGL